MKNIYGLTYDNLEEQLLEINEKKFRTNQIYDWLYIKKANNFNEMTNLSKDLILKLESSFSMNKLILEKHEHDNDVDKFLFKLEDGNYIETVLMKHNYGLSLCISSQVGCNMGCIFCESGRLKKVRNLEVYELVTQILMVEEIIKDRVSHIVLMGIGEPFDNYENVTNFIKIINHPKGLSIGARHITISTCGIIPKIKEFSDFPYQVNLAISLHAPNNKLRNELMPINKTYPVEFLIKEIKEYINKTNRRVTFEYILLDKVNDSEKEALELAKLLRGINAYVNLIPYNENQNFTHKRSKNEQILAFYDILKKEKINVTIRREFGSNISAACGQLRSSKE